MLRQPVLLILPAAFSRLEAVICPPGESVSAFFAGNIELTTGVQQCVNGMEACFFQGSVASGPESDKHYLIDWVDGDTNNRRVHSSMVKQLSTGQPCDSSVGPSYATSSSKAVEGYATSLSSSGKAQAVSFAASQGRPSLVSMKQLYDKAQNLTKTYNDEMTKNPTFSKSTQAMYLQKAVNEMQTLEDQMLKGYLDPSTGQLQMSVDEARFMLEVIDGIASVLEDMNQADKAVQYLYKLVQYEKCKHFQTTQAVLEYEYCSGRLYSRIIIILRHVLKQPDKALEWYNKAVALQYNGQKVHYWPHEWQTPTLFQPGLRSQPFWENDLPLAAWLEKHYTVFKRELLAVLKDKELSKVFTQNDHSLLTQGTWGEQKLFDGKTWKAVCKVAKQSCELLKTRPELMGTFPAEKSHNVHLPKETGYFRLRPGTNLKPHTGPVNFHLYCHLGLIVPEGPRLKVGSGPARKWEEGKATCFDDSYVHEAWHEGTEDRYVLMVTFWHPDLGTPGPPKEEGKTSAAS